MLPLHPNSKTVSVRRRCPALVKDNSVCPSYLSHLLTWHFCIVILSWRIMQDFLITSDKFLKNERTKTLVRFKKTSVLHAVATMRPSVHTSAKSVNRTAFNRCPYIFCSLSFQKVTSINSFFFLKMSFRRQVCRCSFSSFD